jgi:hypothetical protein
MTANEGLEFLVEPLVAKALGIDDYLAIMDSVNRTDVFRDKDFQKTYNRFYVVRRNQDWRDSYYRLFQQCKTKKEVCFQYIIEGLYKSTGQVEASFASKMLATINPDMPIWDSQILNYFKLKPKVVTPEKRLKDSVAMYESIVIWYDEYRGSESAKKLIDAFDAVLPRYCDISATKKIDFAIWSSGSIKPEADK